MPAKPNRETKKKMKESFKSNKKEAMELTKALVPETPAKAGTHNCPKKDAGTTHALRSRCFAKSHVGYCPACGLVVSYSHGCSEHGYGGEDLLKKSPTKEAINTFRISHDLAVEVEDGK